MQLFSLLRGSLLTTVVFLILVTIPAAAADLLPPAEAGAKAFLEASPRHHEWVSIALPGSERKISTFIAFPERKEKAPVVIVIQEVYGLTDWLRAVADSLAAAGFIAMAPDFLTGRGPGGGDTGAFASRDDVVKAVREIPPPEVISVLNAVARYGASLPAATGKFATVGFCWGGAQSFFYATAQPDLNAAVVYYGTSPDSALLEKIRAAVLGLYGEDDARVNVTVEPAVKKMQELGRSFVTHTYPGAGHGFLRAQEAREGANLEAARKAWPATIEHLRKHLE
jgi:carboxymethylenebutenolidase